MNMTPELTSLVSASAEYASAEQKLTDLRWEKSVLLTRMDEVNAAIAAQVPVVQATKVDLKTAVLGL